jgi:hypothetical protein
MMALKKKKKKMHILLVSTLILLVSTLEIKKHYSSYFVQSCMSVLYIYLSIFITHVGH